MSTLSVLEKKIETNIKKAWYENGLCMFEIQQRQLYKKKYKTFKNYLDRRWNYKESHGYSMINGSVLYQEIEHNLLRKNDKFAESFDDKKLPILPKNEGQIRQLLSLDNLSEQIYVWNEIAMSGDKITGVTVKSAVNEFKAHPVEVEEILPHTEYLSSDTHVAKNSGNNEWYTPLRFIESAVQVMGYIDLDPASSELANKTVNARQIFSKDDNGLNKEWFGNVWMNPPYAQPLMNQFSEKLAESIEANLINQAIVLVNNATETSWFQRMARLSSAICFTDKRIKFTDVEGNETGAPLQGQAILYFGSRYIEFNDIFSQHGMVLSNELF